MGAGLKGVEIAALDGQKCCLKRYPHAETARFKVYGSGCLNESLVPDALAADVPKVISHGRTLHEDYAYLELIKGTCLPAADLSRPQGRACGSMLGKINQQRGHWFGSLDGEHRYASWRQSWLPRWKVMIGLLQGVDHVLADRVDAWGTARMDAIDEAFDPFLVHGDYGPGNLIWVPGEPRPKVIDWEHARFGHPAEDWAKIFLAEVFGEANGFRSAGRSRARDAWQGWTEACGKEHLDELLTEEVLTLFMAYFAGTLGVFLDGADNDAGGSRIQWLRDVLKGDTWVVRSLLRALRLA